MAIEVRLMDAVNALLVADNPGMSATKWLESLEGYVSDYADGTREAPCNWLREEAKSRASYPDSYIRFKVEFVGVLPTSDGRTCIWVSFRWTVEHIPRNS